MQNKGFICHCDFFQSTLYQINQKKHAKMGEIKNTWMIKGFEWL